MSIPLACKMGEQWSLTTLIILRPGRTHVNYSKPCLCIEQSLAYYYNCCCYRLITDGKDFLEILFDPTLKTIP